MKWLLVVALVGCAAPVGPSPAVMHGDPTGFTVDEQAAVERGVAWTSERVTGVRWTVLWDLDPGAPAGSSITRAPEAMFPAGAVGLGVPGLRAMWISVALPSDRVAFVAAHEMGHVLGCHGHHDDPNGLMVASSDALELVWTEADARLCLAGRPIEP